MTRRFPLAVWVTFYLVLLLTAPFSGRAAEVEEEEREDPAIRTVMGLTRFVADSTEIALAKLLLNFRNGAQEGKDCLAFYKKLADLKAGMADVITLQKVLRDHAVDYPALREKFFGKSFAEGGSEVEMALLQYRRQVTKDGIDHVVKKFKGRIPKGTVWLAEIGKWATQDPKAMTFAGDIDFSFVSNDMELTMEMKLEFEAYIKKITGLNTIALDSVCTSHGRAGPEVYITNAGQLYGQEQMENGYLKPIDLGNGIVENKQISGAIAIFGMTIASETAKTPGVTIPPRYNKEPGLSMEMVRHFNHDIVKSGLFDTVDSILKASKYVDRSMAEWKGKPPDVMQDAGLIKLANEITAAVQKTPDWVKVAELFKGHFGDKLHYSMAKEGGRPITKLRINQTAIRDFFYDCNKLMWGNVINGAKARLTEINKRGAELEQEGKARNPKETKAYWDQLRDLKDMVETEMAALKRDHIDIPEDYTKFHDELIKAVDGWCDRLKMKSISEDMLKQKKFIEEMVRAKTPFCRNMAVAFIADATIKAFDAGNTYLDMIDDGLLGELRGQNESFDEFVMEAKKVELEIHEHWTDKDYLKKAEDLKTKAGRAILKTAAAKVIQAGNIKMNAVINSTSAGRGFMKGFAGVNLIMEVQAYEESWQKDGFSGLSAEFIRRRIPGGAAAEAFYNGNYGRLCFEVVYVIFPPFALPEGIKGMAEALYGTARDSWWSSELELFTDTLYKRAVFSEIKNPTGPSVFKLECLKYNSRIYLRKDLESGLSVFFADPAFSLNLTKTLADTDPFLTAYEEAQKHEATGALTVERFREKAEKRWEQVKQDYVKKMIVRLEQRKASEKSIETGEIDILFTELEKTAKALRIETELFQAMDKEWDSNTRKYVSSLLKNEKREFYGEALPETEKNRAATVVRSYVEAYREVLQARTRAEKTVEAEYASSALPALSDWNEPGLRWLSGIQMLACNPADDQRRARAWKEKPKEALEAARTKMKLELDKELPNTVPDEPFDAAIAAQLMYESLWEEAYRSASALPPIGRQHSINACRNEQADLMEAFLAHYRERSRPVTIRVFQLRDGKRTDSPIGTASVKGVCETVPGRGVQFRQDPESAGAYVASGLTPGAYLVTIQAEGFESEQGAESAEASFTLPPGRTTPPPLSVWMAPKPGSDALLIDITVKPEGGRLSNGRQSANMADLEAFVTAQPDSGKLYMEWVTGNERLAEGYDARRARFIAEGREAGEYRITLFVRDAKGRTAHRDVNVEVLPAEGYEVKFAEHRAELFRGQGELIKIESPKGDEWNYFWTIRDENGVQTVRQEYGTQWMLDARYFAGKTVTVVVEAQSKRGDKAEAQTAVKVYDTEPATVDLSIKGPDTLELGQTAVFEATGGVAPGTDPAKVLPVTWRLIAGYGKITPSGPASMTFEPDRVGKALLSATRILETTGKSVPQEAQKSIEVKGVTGGLSVCINGPETGRLGDKIELEAITRDTVTGQPVKDGLRYEWSCALGTEAKATFVPGKAGDYVITCKVYLEVAGKAIKTGYGEKRIRISDLGVLSLTVEPAEVMLGQSIKAVVIGAGTEAMVENWDMRGEKDGVGMVCVTSTLNGGEAIFQMLGGGEAFNGVASREIKLESRVRISPDGPVTNLVSAAIKLLPMPDQVMMEGKKGGIKPWLHLPFNWPKYSFYEPVIGFWDFSIKRECLVAEGDLPSTEAGWKPMTVMGYKGWLVPAVNYVYLEETGPGAAFKGDENAISWPLWPVERNRREGFGHFMGVKDKSLLRINVCIVGGTSTYVQPEEVMSKAYAGWVKQVDHAFAAYVGGLPAGAQNTFTLSQPNVPIVTIQPKPELPWRKGDKPCLTAILTGAPELAGKVSYQWEGDVSGKSDTVWPSLAKPGKYKTTAIASEANGEIARVTFEWTISAVDLKIDRTGLKNALLVGDKTPLAAVYEPLKEEGLWLQWDSDMGVVFEPVDEMKQKVTATFAKPGKTKLWVTLYKQTGATHEMFGEAEPIEVEVGKPQFELTAVPDKPYVDQVVTMTLTDTPRLPDDLIRVNWASSDNVREAGPTADKRVYTFRPKDLKPATITATARCQENGEDLGEKPITVQAQPYKVTVSEPLLKGPPPMVYDPKAGKHVEVPRSLGVDQQATVTATIAPTPQKDGVRYRWACTPAEGRAVDAGRPEATISAHEPGTYTLTVTALDADGVELGTGQGAFTVVDNRETSKTPDKAKTAEAEKKYQEAQKLWSNGQLLPAIDSLKIGLTSDPKHEGSKRELERMTRDKERIETAVASGTASLGKMLLTAAESAAEDALRLNPQYPPAKQLKEYAQANKRARDEQAGIVLKEAEAARKACDFKKAVVRLDGLTGTYPELPPEAAQQVAALREDCVARQAEKERRNGLFFQANQAFGKLNDLGVEKILAEALDRADQYFGSDDQGMVQTMQNLRMAAAERQGQRLKAEVIWQEGMALWKQEKLDEAERKLRESNETAPERNDEHTRIHDSLWSVNQAWRDGLAAAGQGDLEKAVGLCTLSVNKVRSEERSRILAELELRWKKQQADSRWATALEVLGNNDIKGAIKFGDRSLGLAPQPPGDRINLVAKWKEADRLWEEGRAAVVRQRYSEALVSCEASVKLVSTEPHVNYLETLKKKIYELKQQKEEEQKATALFMPPQINGSWVSYIRGNEAARCEIIQSGKELEFVIKRVPEVRAKGRFVDPATVVVPEWNNLKAVVQDSGKRLNWGESDWVRPGMQAPINTGKGGSNQAVTHSSTGQGTEKPGKSRGATGKEPFKPVSSSNTVGSGSAKQNVGGSWPASVEGEWSFEANATYKGKLSFASGANGLQGTILFAGEGGPEPLTFISYDALSGKLSFTRPSCIQITTIP